MRLIDLDQLLKFPIRLNHYDEENGDIHFVFGIESVLEYAQYLPTVDAVPVRHAYWIRHEDWEEEGGCGWECSECGMGSEVDYKFCMRCGARMDKHETD